MIRHNPPMKSCGRNNASVPPTSKATAAITRSSAPMTYSAIVSMVASGFLDDHCRAVRHDLAHGLADLGRVEAHHHHRVGTHRLCVLHHAVGGVAAGFLQHLGVFVDLAADDGTQARHHVAADSAAAHHQPEHLSLGFGDLVAGHVFAGHDDHGCFPLRSSLVAVSLKSCLALMASRSACTGTAIHGLTVDNCCFE